MGSGERRKFVWMKVRKGRKEYFKGGDVSNRKGLNQPCPSGRVLKQGTEGLESGHWRQVGSVLGYSRGV